MGTSRRVFSLFCLAVGAMEWVTVATAAVSPHLFTGEGIEIYDSLEVPVMEPQQILDELYTHRKFEKWFGHSINQFVAMSWGRTEYKTQTLEVYCESSLTRKRSIINLQIVGYMYPVFVALGTLEPDEDTNEDTNEETNEGTEGQLYFLEYFVFVDRKVTDTGLILQRNPFEDIPANGYFARNPLLKPYAGSCYDLANSAEARNQYHEKLSPDAEKFVTQYEHSTAKDESGEPIRRVQTVRMQGTIIIKQEMTDWKTELGKVEMTYEAKALGKRVLVIQGKMILDDKAVFQAEFLKIIVFKDEEITRERMIVGEWK